jgi:hypothetical protein
MTRWPAAAIAGTAAVAAGAAWAIYAERVTLRQGLHVLTVRTEPAWVIACVGAQCVSMAAFALVQRCLLKAGGARLTASWLVSTAYLANVIAIAVPVIGSGASSAGSCPRRGGSCIARGVIPASSRIRS